MYAKGLTQFLPFIVTILGIVFTDLLLGIALGMVVAILVILRTNYRNSHFLHQEHIVAGDSSTHSNRIRLRLAEEVTFLNRGAIVKALSNVPDNSHVAIDVSDTVFIDPDVREIIDDFRNTCERRSITVEWIEDRRQPVPAMAS